jgi:hypothetical protein
MSFVGFSSRAGTGAVSGLGASGSVFFAGDSPRAVASGGGGITNGRAGAGPDGTLVGGDGSLLVTVVSGSAGVQAAAASTALGVAFGACGRVSVLFFDSCTEGAGPATGVAGGTGGGADASGAFKIRAAETVPLTESTAADTCVTLTAGAAGAALGISLVDDAPNIASTAPAATTPRSSSVCPLCWNL